MKHPCGVFEGWWYGWRFSQRLGREGQWQSPCAVPQQERFQAEPQPSRPRHLKLLFSLANTRCWPKGLPLGNLTSQLLVNVYMNEFDQFAKHTLQARCYIRYADDFVFLSADKQKLESILPQINTFLRSKLKLDLHPDKVSISTLASGVDFLGWVHFPDHRVLRTATKRRMLRAVGGSPSEATVVSYVGMLGHGNAGKLKEYLSSLSR